MAEPPLRLILGSEAYAYATAAARARAESDAAWHDLTVSTDRDDATAAQRDPLRRRAADQGEPGARPGEECSRSVPSLPRSRPGAAPGGDQDKE